MSPHRLALAAATLAAFASAQSATVTVQALTPLVATAGTAAQVWTSTLPAGPLPSSGQLGGTQTQQGAPRNSRIEWDSSVTNAGVSCDLVQYVSPGPAGSYGSTGTSEFLVTMAGTGGPAVPWRLEGQLVYQNHPSAGMLYSVDLDNDGSIDWTPNSYGPIGAYGSDLTAQPLQIRIVCQTLVSGTDPGNVRLELRIVPANVDALRIAASCYNWKTLNVTPLMWGNADVLLQSQNGGTLSWKVLGFALNPTPLPVTLTETPLPCIGLPSPDWIHRTPTMFLAIPQAVRPITLYAQSLDWFSPGLRPSDAFVITAQ